MNPLIHDFSIISEEGGDLTESILNDSNYTFLLIAPYLESATVIWIGLMRFMIIAESNTMLFIV